MNKPVCERCGGDYFEMIYDPVLGTYMSCVRCGRRYNEVEFTPDEEKP